VPRNIDLVDELKKLKEAHNRGDHFRRQYFLRLDTGTAIAVIEQCLAREVQPGPFLESVVEETVLDRQRGAVVNLNHSIRNAVDTVAKFRNQTREAYILSVLDRVVWDDLQAAIKTAKERQKLQDEAETLTSTD
jgi:hypothetical protein